MGRTVGIFRHNLFVPSETFIRNQASFLTNYSPIFIARRKLGHVPPGAEAVTLASNVGRLGDLKYAATGKSSALRTLVQQTGVSLIHAHFGPDGLYAMDAAQSAGVPLVVTLHGRDVTVTRSELMATLRPVAIRYSLMRHRLSEANTVLCVSNQIRDAALEIGIPKERLVTHYVGVDTEYFREAPWPREKKIAHVARLVEKKGTEHLIRAFAGLNSHKDAYLYIVGEGPLRNRLSKLARELGVGERVHFCGQLRTEEVRSLVAESRVFCLPSVTAQNGDKEGLPTALIEAMSLGTAVVSTRHAGIPEAVNSSDCGVLVEERDEAGLAEALDYLLADHSAAERLGGAAAARIRGKFDIRIQSQELEKIYSGVSG